MSGMPGTVRAFSQKLTAAVFQSGSGGESSAVATAASSADPVGSPTGAKNWFRSTVTSKSGSMCTPPVTSIARSARVIVAACGVSWERIAIVPVSPAGSSELSARRESVMVRAISRTIGLASSSIRMSTSPTASVPRVAGPIVVSVIRLSFRCDEICAR
ncbi:Uncharacterised protein [Mycobacteroides abscessus subsp. abscessus]|nr:Uncharacterised protein [Mycobacteroides abscessus subsp. abscessus]